MRDLEGLTGEEACAVLGLRVRDTTAGYRAYRASILRAMDIESTHSTGYAFQIEMTYRALSKGKQDRR